MKKTLGLMMVMVMLGGALTGCGEIADSGANNTQTEVTTQNEADNAGDAEEVTGTIAMNGSTSMEKLASALNEGFMIKYPKVTASAEFTGSGAGIESVASGTADIGNSSRSLKEEELSKGLVENVVAIDGIAVVVDNANTVANLSKDQLSGIYSGTITNWSEVDGSDQMIVVIGREASSGTRGAFEELLELEDKCKYAQEIDSTGAVMAKVAATPGAIGYVSLDVIDDTVKPLSLDGVEPTVENIKGGTYFLSRPFVMATKGKISEQSDAVQAMFEYIDSEEGQSIIAKVGLISAK